MKWYSRHAKNLSTLKNLNNRSNSGNIQPVNVNSKTYAKIMMPKFCLLKYLFNFVLGCSHRILVIISL